ncbi:MAG: AbrB/MazE/SpoVT family DNA-binding domain-containing protein [Gammaproteobacteria bacterium]
MASMGSTSVTSKGQVTIPKEIRRRLGIRAGTKLEFQVVGDHAELRVTDRPTVVESGGFGLLKSRRASVPADFDVASILRRK